MERIDGSSLQDYRALSLFRHQIRKFLHFSEMAARAEGLEPQQHQLLLAIRVLEPEGSPSVGQLAEHLLLRHHSTVGLIDRLEKKGLVERVRDAKDRRQVRVRLTAAGAVVLERLANLHRSELRNTGPGLVAALKAILEEGRDGESGGKAG